MHFKNRKYRKNFKDYKGEIRMIQYKILHKCIPEELRSLNQYYLVVCVDSKDIDRMWEFIAWNLINFERFSAKFAKSLFEKYYSEIGVKAIEAIAKFFDIDYQNQKIIMKQGVIEYLDKQDFDKKPKSK